VIHAVSSSPGQPIVLAIDDDELNLDKLQRVLRKDYIVHTAASGGER